MVWTVSVSLSCANSSDRSSHFDWQREIPTFFHFSWEEHQTVWKILCPAIERLWDSVYSVAIIMRVEDFSREFYNFLRNFFPSVFTRSAKIYKSGNLFLDTRNKRREITQIGGKQRNIFYWHRPRSGGKERSWSNYDVARWMAKWIIPFVEIELCR